MRLAIRVGVAIFTFLGVVIGVAGTLLMTRVYHPYTSWQIFRNMFGVIGRWLFRGREEADALLDASAVLGEVNRENRSRSLLGLYLLILSFMCQTLGAALAIVDALLPPEQH
jgi:hypothetical protein